jgi:hypothetical protein
VDVLCLPLIHYLVLIGDSIDRRPLIFIIISASLFGINTPLAKLLVGDIAPVVLAGLLYLGAFVGLSLYAIGRKKRAVDHNKIPTSNFTPLRW